MIPSDVRRCDDCLDEFGEAPRWLVLKEDKSSFYSDGRPFLYQAVVCRDCAGWYEDPVDVEEA